MALALAFLTMALVGCTNAPKLGGVYVGTLSDCDPVDLDGLWVELVVLGDRASIVVLDEGMEGDACATESATIDPEASAIVEVFESSCGELTASFQATLNFDEDRHTAEGVLVGDVSSGDGDFPFSCDVNLSEGESE